MIMNTGMLLRVLAKIKFEIQSKFNCNYYSKLGIEYCGEKSFADQIRERLEQGTPTCVGKIGGNELNSLFSKEINDEKFSKMSYDRLCYFAGFFPDKYDRTIYDKYIGIQRDAVNSLDYIIRFDKLYEEIVLRKFRNKKLQYIDSIGSWQQTIPWTRELEGYKVVVVHPFAELIEKQYKRREDIYPGSNVLPAFDLRVVKAVQTMAGADENRFDSWFDALNYMYNEIMKEDFDIALIGCGAYGLPLAAKIKDAGKIGVHMGGDLQMLFGIRGKRWDDREKAQKWFNDAWVRPGEEYKVSGYESVEDGCYW